MNKENESSEGSAESIENVFQKELESLPEVSAYIERLQAIILRQRNLLIKFYSERRAKTDASSQTDGTVEQANVEEKCEETPSSSSKPVPDSWCIGDEKLGVSIQQQVAQAAESAMKQTGFVYEQTSGMYYDYNTGYYYNAELGLYYDGNTGTYYYYDEARKTFHFHSKVELGVRPVVKEEPSSQQPCLEESPDKNKFSEESVKTKRKLPDIEDEEKQIKKVKPEEMLEEGECSSDSDADNDSAKSDVSSSNKVETKVETKDKTENETKVEGLSEKSPESNEVKAADTLEDSDPEISKQYPPCMRVIVQESSVKNLKVGTLFMITWPGGTLGREGDHSVLIQDFNVSKYHAKFSFSGEDDKGNYVLVDLGSKNGTYLNGKRLSVALSESDPFPVDHGSIIQIGSTKLLCHVHSGQETCSNCEPGVMISEEKKTAVIFENKEEKHRTELKRLKQKYRVESIDSTLSQPAPGYEDKADIRRKKVGSVSDSFKTETASVEESIPKENKGFKMLAKMGWNKGQALGKGEKADSITEPIMVFQRSAKAGLGSENSVSVKALDPKEEKKQELWRKTQQRFKKLK